MTVAVFESAVPATLLTRTQKLLETARGGVVKDPDVAPRMGFVMSPEVPRYHWKVKKSPEALVENVAVSPVSMVAEIGWLVMSGGKMTLAVTVPESAIPAALVALNQ